MEKEIIESKPFEKIELRKMSNGQYNWEIKFLGSGENGKLLKNDLKRLDNFNEIMKTKYGERNEN